MCFYFAFLSTFRNFVAVMLELNEVCLKTDNAVDHSTVSMMAMEGRVTCITGGTPRWRSRMLLAMLGLAPLSCGYISVDGEPVDSTTARDMRRLMAYVPARLTSVGETTVYAAPKAGDVFRLHANRHSLYSVERIEQEKKLIAPDGAGDERIELLAVAALMQRPILLVDNPPALCADYLVSQAESGKVVVVGTDDDALLRVAHQIVEL